MVYWTTSRDETNRRGRSTRMISSWSTTAGTRSAIAISATRSGWSPSCASGRCARRARPSTARPTSGSRIIWKGASAPPLCTRWRPVD